MLQAITSHYRIITNLTKTAACLLYFEISSFCFSHLFILTSMENVYYVGMIDSEHCQVTPKLLSLNTNYKNLFLSLSLILLRSLFLFYISLYVFYFTFTTKPRLNQGHLYSQFFAIFLPATSQFF
jgi:hypothetical protein